MLTHNREKTMVVQLGFSLGINSAINGIKSEAKKHGGFSIRN
jgi:hypothetical protein